MLPSLSEETNAPIASWAHQVATAEEHDDPVVVNAHNTEVLILFLRLKNICAGCNLQQHAASYSNDLGPDLTMCTRTYVRATG